MIRQLRLMAGALLFAGNAFATIITVPATYSTIQAGILAASDGDTVAVSPGTYYENINFRGRNIVLTSLFYLAGDTSYIRNTIINGSQPVHPDTASCIILNSYEDSTTLIQGFTITGGSGTKWFDIHGAGTYREGGGILTEFASPVIRYNYIHDNYVNNTSGVNSTGGGAIRSGDGHPIIINNVICNNEAYGYGGGIVLNYCRAEVINNLIVYNSGGHAFGGGGVWCTGAGNTTVVNLLNNTVAFNQSQGTGTYGGKAGGLFVFTIKVNVRNCIFWGNTQVAGGDYATYFGGLIDTEYSDIETVTPGTGNISVPPQFADSSFFLLATGSPCIDAGDLASTYADATVSPGVAAFPSMGTERNDMGIYGGGKTALLPVCSSGITGILPSAVAPAFKCYPVPAGDAVTLVFPGEPAENTILTVLDVQGKTVLNCPLRHAETRVELAACAPGVYFLVVSAPGQANRTMKLQVLH